MRTRLLTALAGVVALSAAGGAAAQQIGQPGAASLYGGAKPAVDALPTDAEVTAATPPRKTEGSAAAHCTAGPSGVLEGCTVMIQRGGPAFGQALLSLAPKYRLRPSDARPAGTDVVITASWPVVETPVAWQVPPKEGDFATNATPAVAKYGKPGSAVLNCLIGRLGTTYDCMVVYQQPYGVGMGTMILRLAPYLKVKPALLGGKPTPAAVNFPFEISAATTDAIR
ncbi:hypothetical protein [Phenylobacterium sp.]|uniref:hypothetical protein n=1 Tax=Phenylobacterium sp. TaxID=1871053 RepID=UPI002C4EDB6F|nr:hypothetical protein [Phenylobacterium sp.]HLZ76413.1 hypothetical protein [Phenylobacterium sp.]